MSAHGLQSEVELSNFLALQISNAVSQALESKQYDFDQKTYDQKIT